MPVSMKLKINKASLRRVDKLLKVLDLRDRRSPIVEKALTIAALRVQKIAAEDKIVRGRGLDAPPLPDQITFRRGGLSRSIFVDKSNVPRSISVKSDLIYAAGHELGLGRFPPRPYLAPALEDVEGDPMAEIFVDVIDDELRRASR